MRYKWIELCGYGGFYNGMGLTELKIDFTKCKSNKIIIRGGNGSGKTTLQDAINPLPDTNDKFIPNMEARKTICISDNNIDYVIRYIHPINNSGRGTTKGYISKTINGSLVELNPNGNISSCKDIIYEEFNLDASYVSLSKLSSENRGIVDSKPAERKKNVLPIISALEAYNGIYKTLSKKSSGLKQMINSLTYKIERLGNENQLQNRLQNATNRINQLEQERDNTIEAIASIKLKISEYMDILRDNNYDTIVTELKGVNSHIKSITNSITRSMNLYGIDDMERLEDFYNHISTEIIKLESYIDSLNQKSQILLQQRETDYSNLQTKNAKLQSLQSDYNYIDIKNAIARTKSIITECETVFDQMHLFNINIITSSDFESAMQSLNRLKELANRLTGIHYISFVREYVDARDKCIKCINDIGSNIIYLNELNERKATVSKQIAIYESKMQIIADLEIRPKECTIDTCQFIKTALETYKQYPPEKLNKLKDDEQELETAISVVSKNIEIGNIYKDIKTIIDAIEAEFRSNLKYLKMLPLSPTFAEDFIERAINEDPFYDIDDLYKFIDCGNLIDMHKNALDQLKIYESEFKIYEEKNNIITSIMSEIQELSEKTDALLIEIDNTNEEISRKKKELVDLTQAKTKVWELCSIYKEDLLPSIESRTGLEEAKLVLDKNSVEINNLQSTLNTLNTNLGSVNNDIKSVINEKDSINHSLLLLQEYKQDFAQYNNDYTKIEKIRYYASPSTGIQTLYMQLYMNQIINTANNLLSLLFEGEFVLQPFVINDSEFRIPCLGSGLLHDDISSMSTAQKCMISMILSFSILHQSSTKYNILRLDEIDGGLDTSNRGYFVELIDRIMVLLNSEQCFIISHNNELDTASCDLIVLKNAGSEIYRGNVIWQY